MQSSQIETLHTFDTVYSADSVEWCPINSFENYFVCGTYQLEDRKDEEVELTVLSAKRKGRLFLFKYDLQDNLLNLVKSIDTEAILDQKWHSKEAKLALVNSIGELQLYKMNEGGDIQMDTKIKIDDSVDDLLALSLDWSPQNDRIVVSDSKGSVSVLKVNEGEFEMENRWATHSFEAWTCAFDKSSSNIIYTGGDDTFLCAYDLRDSMEPVMKWKNKSHNAGVTSLLSFDERPNILATGSYDEMLRIFDVRKIKCAITEINLGGGIWRMKLDPFDRNQILCACMYHNFSIVTISDDNQDLQLSGAYNEHKSICYGCDWCSVKSEDGTKFLATCSFYDHKLCLSSVKN